MTAALEVSARLSVFDDFDRSVPAGLALERMLVVISPMWLNADEPQLLSFRDLKKNSSNARRLYGATFIK